MGLRNVQDLFISNKTVVSPREKVLVSATAATGTINFDCISNSVVYYTSNASANWTLNLRGNANNTFNSVTRIGETFTVVFMVTNSATAYYPTGFTIDGTSVTPKWFGGAAPTAGSINSIDAYTYNVVKTASAAYTVFASQSRFA
jgi:hypothetical protein